MHDFTLFKSPSQNFFAWAINDNAHLFAASYPSSVVRSFPSLPFIKVFFSSIEICPEINKKLLLFLHDKYYPTGSDALGKFILFFFKFSSGLILFF